ncbi:MAG: glycerol-3-phosphate 1-O-acyltransferase PlsY [Bacteroidales bacterium]|nr:glycerol-3-phosphate 1-O-acyltransferase PlsY [Bacteroidales bacterium]
MISLLTIAGVVLAYLIGSIPTSVIVGRIFYRIDVREEGSGNAGATNTIRVLGYKAGVPVLLFDVFKAWLAVFLAGYFGAGLPGQSALTNYKLIMGIAAVLGHVFPVYIGFKGGKGVAALVGVVVAMLPYTFFMELGIFAVIVIATRYVSLASVISAVAFPFVVIFIFNVDHLSLIVFSIIVAVMVPVTHRKNIKRLLEGRESKFKPRGKNNE